VPPGDARRPDLPLGRRTREVRSLDLIDALSEIDGRTRDGNAPSVHHVDAVGDCQGLVDVLLDHQHASAVIGRATQHRKKSINNDRCQSDGKLVRKDKSWSARECQAKREHLLLAAREKRDASIEVRRQLRGYCEDRIRARAGDVQSLAEERDVVCSARASVARDCQGFFPGVTHPSASRRLRSRNRDPPQGLRH
jgi:hypothetical protein